MNFKKIVIIIALLLPLLILPIVALLKPAPKEEVKPPAAQTVIKKTLPYSPQSVNFGRFLEKDLPKSLPIFEVRGLERPSLSYLKILNIARNLGFGTSPEIRPAYGGGQDYIFTNDQSDVLSLRDTPAALSFSKLPVIGGELPNLAQAETLAREFLDPVLEGLPNGWQLKATQKTYLAGGGSTAREVADRSLAQSARVSFAYFYNGYKILNSRGESNFLNFTFGPGDVIISAQVNLFIGKEIEVIKVGEGKTLNTDEVRGAFAKGEAQPVSLELNGVVSDEAILTPPQSVKVENLEPVLVLGGGKLYPYYLISSLGRLNSEREGRVDYLLPAIPRS